MNNSNLPHAANVRLTLVSHVLCPFVQRAAIALFEKGIAFERIDIDLGNKPEWFLALSPMGKVPLLIIADDESPDRGQTVLFESMAICEYINDAFPLPSLYPDHPIDRARHRGWVEFASALLGDVWGFVNAKDSETAIARKTATGEKLLRLENALSDGPYFGGAAFGMVDIVIAPVFRYFDILPEQIGAALFASTPRLTAWRRTLATHPGVMAAVGADYGQHLYRHLARHDATLAPALAASWPDTATTPPVN